jgi:hypothetical protein
LAVQHAQAQAETYLDSAELKDWLEHFDSTYWSQEEEEAGLTFKQKQPNDERAKRREADIRQALTRIGSLDAVTRRNAHHVISTLRRAMEPEGGSINDRSSRRTRDGDGGSSDSNSSGGRFGDSRVLRVFIFDLASEDAVLLDRFHQAVGFAEDGMVVAVQTRASSASVDFSCDGRSLALNPRDAARATLGAILTTGWGVAPSFVRWSSALRDTEHDFLFSLGHTPFGPPFSQSKVLHFGLRDAAVRNVLLSELHESMRDMKALLARLRPSPSSSAGAAAAARVAAALAGGGGNGGDDHHHHLAHASHLGRGTTRSGPSSALLDSLLYASPRVDFVRRVNVLTFQQARAAHWLNLNHMSQAWLYIQAAAHDMRQLVSLVRREVEELEVTLRCGGDSASDASVAGLPLSQSSAASGGSASSASAVLSSSGPSWAVFAALEGLVLLVLVVTVWFASSYPHLAAKALPDPVARLLGLGRFKPKQY